MLKASNVPIESVLKLFNGAGATIGLLVPTPTGYGKSIMDATFSFRDFLNEMSIHDYASQKQGPENKVLIPSYFVFPDRLIKTNASLYRPCTKNGDPRVWFHGLTKYCKPTDLLAIVALSGELYVFNMSNKDVVAAFGIPQSYPYSILKQCAQGTSSVAEELLGKLRKIHQKGFVKGISHGDTNVGMTLENLLGIPPNPDKTPDYKGIEIKSSRTKGRAKPKDNRVTLFANVPDWKRSPFDAVKIVKTFGYVEGKRLQLYCTVSNKKNPQGLYLDAKNEIDLINKADTDKYKGDVAVWALKDLKTRLSEKHHETFWVQASRKIIDGTEYFQYNSVKHTRNPNVANMASMFEAGIITLDYAMHMKSDNIHVRDHGYLFRTTVEKLPLIFPIELLYDLST